MQADRPLSQKPAKSDAFILHVGEKFLVRPAAVVVGKRRVFRISNLTGFVARVQLPPEIVVDNNPGKYIDIPSQQYGEFEIGENTEVAFPYTVTLGVGTLTFKAHGDSDPVIIIDPAP